MIRYIDVDERMVQVFKLPQDPGQVKPGDFRNAFQHHKLTYYLCGMLSFLALLGVGVMATFLVQLCSRALRGHGIRSNDCECGDSALLCGECCRACCIPHYHPFYGCTTGCGDCMYCCTECSRAVCTCEDRCCETAFHNLCPSGGNNDGHPLAILLVIVVVAFIIIGILAAVVVLVTATQKAIQKYAQLQQLGVLTREYIVQDLADASDLGDGEQATAPRAQEMGLELERKEDQEELQQQISRDLQEILGDLMPRQALQNYGSTR